MFKILHTSFLFLFLFFLLSACQAQKTEQASVSLIDTHWEVVYLYGGITLTDKKPSMFLSSEKSSIKGFAGCNRFFGQYLLDKSTGLSFSHLGATRKMCQKTMDLEQQFLNVLSQTVNFKIIGNTLLLKDINNKDIAKFKS